MPRVALVFPYFRTRAATEMLFPPLGVAALAGQLRRLGIETRVFDGTFGTFEGLLADLESYRPDIVGLSAMVSLTRNTFRIADAIRASLPQASAGSRRPPADRVPAALRDATSTSCFAARPT